MWKSGLKYDTVHCSGIINLGAGMLLLSVALSAEGKLSYRHLTHDGSLVDRASSRTSDAFECGIDPIKGVKISTAGSPAR